MTRGNTKVEPGQLRKRIETIHSIVKRSAIPKETFLVVEVAGSLAQCIDGSGETLMIPADLICEFTEVVE